jgi:hypothetical protein
LHQLVDAMAAVADHVRGMLAHGAEELSVHHQQAVMCARHILLDQHQTVPARRLERCDHFLIGLQIDRNGDAEIGGRRFHHHGVSQIARRLSGRIKVERREAARHRQAAAAQQVAGKMLVAGDESCEVALGVAQRIAGPHLTAAMAELQNSLARDQAPPGNVAAFRFGDLAPVRFAERHGLPLSFDIGRSLFQSRMRLGSHAGERHSDPAGEIRRRDIAVMQNNFRIRHVDARRSRRLRHLVAEGSHDAKGGVPGQLIQRRFAGGGSGERGKIELQRMASPCGDKILLLQHPGGPFHPQPDAGQIGPQARSRHRDQTFHDWH